MPYSLNTITKPDEGTKHVQRQIRRNKKVVYELRMKSTGLLVRKVPYGKWISIPLENLIGWAFDPNNSKVRREASS